MNTLISILYVIAGAVFGGVLVYLWHCIRMYKTFDTIREDLVELEGDYNRTVECADKLINEYRCAINAAYHELVMTRDVKDYEGVDDAIGVLGEALEF